MTAAAPIPPALLTADEAAAYIGMSRRWVWRATSAGLFPQPVRVGGATRWRRADLDRWIADLEEA